MDDMTYDALKQHSHLLPVTYFSIVAIHLEGAQDDLLQAHIALFKLISPNAPVMLCNSFAIIDKKSDSQKSSLCCARF
jgi:hypothetical protein